jgi:nicotinamidase-related amidase
MTTLPNRPNTALLVIDVQTGVVAGNHDRDGVIANIARLVEKARGESVSVIWVRHQNKDLVKGDDRWQIVAEPNPHANEPMIEKFHGDAFEDTGLESVLAHLGVGRLVVTGAQSDACIRSTIHGAFTRGYDVTLVSDAHTTEDMTAWGAPPPGQVIAFTNMYWAYQTAPGRTGDVVKAAELDFRAHG